MTTMMGTMGRFLCFALLTLLAVDVSRQQEEDIPHNE